MSAQHPSTAPATQAHPVATGSSYPKHRLEGLTDGIYAVAMTLLALELKLPDVAITTSEQLGEQLAHLIPHFISWPLSFAILAIFWFAQQRVFRYLRAVDGKVVVINLISLCFVTLLPFSTMLIGAHPKIFISHVIYAAVMTVLSVLSIWHVHYISTHPELTTESLPRAFVKSAFFRCWALIACAALSVVFAWFIPKLSSMAYMAMALISPLSHRFATNAQAPR